MTSMLKKKKTKQQGTEKRTWIHSSDTLRDGYVLYSVKFLGVTEVSQAKGTDIIKDAIKKVQFARHIKKSETGTKASKLKKVDLKISIDNVKVEDTKTKEEMYVYPLHRISYCADDKGNKKLFAFIAKDKQNPGHMCYVFECDKMAEELTLTVGQAFDLAYRQFLERKGGEAANQEVSAMEQRMKAAEAEKEALKKKIEELEQSKNGMPPNGHEQHQDFFDRGPVQSPAAPTVGQDVFDLLGGFNGPSSEQNYQGSENLGDLEFDPFANVGEPGAPQVADTQVSSSPFTALPAEQFDQGQHGMVARPRPGTSGQVPMGLPPPPTKQSIKAANRSKAASPPPVTSPVSPPAPTTSATSKYCETNGIPRRRPSASKHATTWENFHSTINADFLDLDAGSSVSNPFTVDPFEANSFDPLESSQMNNNTGNLDLLNLQQGFSAGLTIDHDIFGSNA